ncbi:MAG: macro domain-containing protein [Firmicutes bacterium]|nr:macro domain-containing protein [Bacillota bacterium]
MIYKVGGTEILIIQGDITDCEVDAIVNPANNQLYMGTGVAGAIKKKGGQEIEDEAVKQGPIDVGDAIITSAGKLKANYVVHAAVMGINLITDAEKIRKATLSALNVAERTGIKRIAFPALGTGVGGFPYNEAARVMYKIIKEHLNRGESSLDEIVLVLYGYEAYNEFLARAEKDLAGARV